MSSSNPYKLLLIGASIIAAGYAVLFVVTSIAFFHHNYWYFLLTSTIAVFFLSYFVFSHILERYIYDKIKIIYKTIHTFKVSGENKKRKVDLRQNVFGKVNDDVAVWVEEQKKEVDDLKKLELYRKEFLGNVSHELKTPIFNIQGYILTLLDGAMDDTNVNRDYLEKSEKNIERMINIVQDLEIISQLEAGEIRLVPTTFDIVALIHEIFEMLEIKAQKRKITFHFHDSIDDDSEVFVEADKEKIRQVLINLIENSIKYGNEGGRTKVSFYDMDENVLVEISDNGIGIDAVHIPRLFERFYRVDKSRSRNQGGSGLGLAIVKHIIESHQQTVNVRSAPGVGSTFSLTLKKG
jgi:two-component system phosphate regulon sensor histidine kinase PhoR